MALLVGTRRRRARGSPFCREVWGLAGARRSTSLVQPGAPDPEISGAIDDALKWRLYFFLANPTSREGPKSMLLGISGWSSRGEEWVGPGLKRAGLELFVRKKLAAASSCIRQQLVERTSLELLRHPLLETRSLEQRLNKPHQSLHNSALHCCRACKLA